VNTLQTVNKLKSPHSQQLNSIIWPHSSILYSTSNDGLLCAQSVEKGSVLNTWQIKYHTLTKASYCGAQNLIAAGSSDCKIRMFDPRMNEENHEAQLILKSHTNTVSSVKFNPSNSQIFASVSFDNTVKLWDLRSTLPLSTITQHTAQLFDCEWFIQNDETILATCGADKELRFHRW